MNEVATIERPSQMVESNPATWMQYALENGLAPEKIGQLMDVYERWQKQQSEMAYANDMALCKAEVPVVAKDKKNNFTGSPYATLEAIDKAVTPVIARHGFSLDYNESPSSGPGSIKITATCTHKLGHKREFSLEVPLDGTGAGGGKSSMNAIQAKGSTVTYARRYLKCMIFDIATGDDNDGNGDTKVASELENWVYRLKHVEEISQLNAIWADYHKLGSTKLKEKVAAEIKAFVKARGDVEFDHAINGFKMKGAAK